VFEYVMDVHTWKESTLIYVGPPAQIVLLDLGIMPANFPTNCNINICIYCVPESWLALEL
jgi:hypothetical protein